MYKNKVKKAFTLIELLVVLAITAVLISLGFLGMITLRDSVSVGNTIQSIKTAIRDAQDKALTVSSYNNSSGSGPTIEWIYGYSLSYDSVANKLNLTTIIDNTDDISIGQLPNGGNTQKLRDYRKNLIGPNDECFSSIFGPLFGKIKCGDVNSYNLETTNLNFNCNIFVSSVNGQITIPNGNTCDVVIAQHAHAQTITLDEKGLGDIKICDGSSTCT